MQAEMCKGTVFVPELGGEGFNITVFEPGTRNTSIQEKRSHCCHCADYFPPPTRQVTRPQQSEGQRAEGQSPRVANTHIHTKTVHQYYKPQCSEQSRKAFFLF